MTADSQTQFFEDPGLPEILRAFQEERWNEGLEKLDDLMEKYPFEQDLRRLRQEMILKSRIDAYEEEEVEQTRQANTRRTLLRIGAVILFIAVIVLGSTTYAGVIQRQVSSARDVVEQEFTEIELGIKFRSAQNLLNANRPEEALVLLEEIRAEDPDYENLEDFIAVAQGQLSIEGRYESAVEMIENEEWADALALLEDIEGESPRYKDVQLLIEDVERALMLQAQLAEADQAFSDEDWQTSVDLYEGVRIADASFETEHVEDRLLNSYVNAALEILAAPDAELEELGEAEELFRKALSLSPQDDNLKQLWDRARATVRNRLISRYLEEAEAALVNQEDSLAALQVASSYLNRARALDPNNAEVAVQADLINRYLQAFTDFRNSLWDLVITNLEYIYTINPGFAAGTARQTLYDVRIIRGNNYLAVGDFELALSDYRRAVELAQADVEGGALGTYEAQLKVAFTLGLLFDYEGAVVMYQTAVETGDLIERFGESDPAFVSSLQDADSLAQSGSFRLAYIRYRDLFDQNQLVYSEFVIHVVEEGDYLTSLANLYNSSVQAIATANDLADPNRIFAGDELIIPIFPEEN